MTTNFGPPRLDLATKDRRRRLLAAARSDTWLPDDAELEGLAALRERHAKVLAMVRETVARVTAIEQRQEQEQRQHEDAALAAAREGKVPDAPVLDAGLDAELRAAQLAVDAARKAFEEEVVAITHALGTDIAPQVDALVAKRRQEAEQTRRDAEAMLAAASARVRAVKKLDLWFDVLGVPGRNRFPMAPKTPVPWSKLLTPPDDYRPSDDAMRFAGLGHLIDAPAADDAFEDGGVMSTTVNIRTGKVTRTAPQKVVANTWRGGKFLRQSTPPTAYPAHWFPEIEARRRRKASRIHLGA